MAGQNRASMRRKLRSALAHKGLADDILDNLLITQQKWNTTLDKLNVDAASAILAVAATAVLDLTADITLTSVATGAARNTTTFTSQVIAAAPNPTNTILVSFTGTAAAITVTITPNDGTNNAATPVDLTTAQLVELINTGVVVGKTITLTDASSRRTLQTAAGGDATNLADGGEGDGVVATFSGGVTAVGGLDTNYVSAGTLSSIWDPEASVSGQNRVSARNILRSSLSHRQLADTLADMLVVMQSKYTALLTKLDAEAGTLNDINYASLLSMPVLNPVDPAIPAQHSVSMRTSLRSALANQTLADDILDAVSNFQTSFNAALVILDTAAINGAMAVLKVDELPVDAE